MNKIKSRVLFLMGGLLGAGIGFGAPVSIYCPPDVPAIQFAAKDLQQSLEKQGNRSEILPISTLSGKPEQTRFVFGLAPDAPLLNRLQAAGGKAPAAPTPEGYAIRLTRQDNRVTVWAIGADVTGAMYAGLALAETVAQSGIKGIEEADGHAYIAKRGLKINIPLDARTPAYADCGDAAQQNMAVMWDIEFWKQQLDAMARDRYNTVTLWNAHPFPSLVKVPEYPAVAIEDVKIANINWRAWFPKNAGFGGTRGVTKDILDHLKTIKRMTMDEKISFWREVMQYAHDRGIEVHFMTWNIFVWEADGKYGITDSVENEITVDYLRKSVRSLFETYPLLAGIGVTAGEHMNGLTADQKEEWLWKTYGLGVMDAKKDFPGRQIRFIHRHWQSKIPDITKHFAGFDEDVQQRFPGKPAGKLQEVWARASKIIPAVNRAHWHDWDFQWAVETCQGRNGYHAITDKCWQPGETAAADEIQGHADFVVEKLVELRKIEGDKTWQYTLGDIGTMAHLGNYYAEKLRAADARDKQPALAVEHLKKAAEHWKKYAAIGSKQYRSQLLSKAGWFDWQQGYTNALKDISLMQGKQF